MDATRRILLLAIATGLVALALPAAATASEICVAPKTGCSGPEVSTLEDALDLADDDFALDRVHLGPTLYKAQSKFGFTYTGGGAVEIIGAGAERTILTGPVDTSWVMMLSGGPGSVIRDLTIRLPEDVSANAFALHTRNLARRVKVVAAYQQHYEHIGVYLEYGGTFEDSSVDLNRLPETTALAFHNGGGTVRDSSLKATRGINSRYGDATIERSRVTGFEYGIRAAMNTTTVRNSLVEVTGYFGAGIRAETSAGADTTLNVDGVTVVAPDAPDVGGIGVTTGGAPDQSATVHLSNSIYRGGGGALFAQSGGSGAARLVATYSDYDPTYNTVLGANASIDATNVSNVADAGFADAADGDYRLLATSVLLDRGDPAAAQGLDLVGKPLVADGNGDGLARRDLGAYELQPAAVTRPPTSGGGGAADSAPPRVTGFRATRKRFTAARGTRFRWALSEPARVTVTIRRGARRVGALRRAGAAGANALRFRGRLGRHSLRPGRYRAVIRAVDAAGNRSEPRVARFRVARGR